MKGIGEYSGQVVAVSGGRTKLGRAIVSAFAGAGATVVTLDAGNTSGQAEITKRSLSGVINTTAAPTLSGARSVARGVVRQHGKVDVLVHVPSVRARRSVLESRGRHWNQDVERQLSAVFSLACAFGGEMAAAGSGSIVTLASVDLAHAYPGRLTASALMGGLLGLTRGLATEWATLGIRANLVAYGLVANAAQLASMSPAAQERILACCPAGRFGRPSEVASAVLFVAGRRATFMTGQVLAVDGGWGSFNQGLGWEGGWRFRESLRPR